MIIGVELGLYQEIPVQLFQLRWGFWEGPTKSLESEEILFFAYQRAIYRSQLCRRFMSETHS